MDVNKRRIGVVGFGSLGQYLVEEIQARPELELAFVWNRSKETMQQKLDERLILNDLSKFSERNADIIVEVCHPKISEQYGESFLENADYMVGSPSALANQDTEDKLRNAAKHHGMYIPSGAFWGGEDIKKMADRGTLQALKVTMTFHRDSLKLCGQLEDKNKNIKDNCTVLYDGPVRGLCPLAPNNVNTMAAASIAAHNLGFDNVQGCLKSEPNSLDFHIVEVEAWGPGNIEQGTAFHVRTVRKNPAKVGAVSGKATYASFLSSLLGAHGKGPGVHLC
ncbi:unnamed protein product [Owenia fusiformis]|uniref:Aspartate dehydrogenase domain-containing protein n=1 Tax=Owenia fusiformis TaxID=6347 RepID=A0A8S4Q609_OWEFU|nr:unnamed protein product [Owenia fusiformis]